MLHSVLRANNDSDIPFQVKFLQNRKQFVAQIFTNKIPKLGKVFNIELVDCKAVHYISEYHSHHFEHNSRNVLSLWVVLSTENGLSGLPTERKLSLTRLINQNLVPLGVFLFIGFRISEQSSPIFQND